MIKTALVPLDRSQDAESILPYVELIASRIGATLRLLTVVQGGRGASEVPETLGYLEGKGGELRSWSLSVLSEAARGDEAETILQEAEARRADLIAMSTHGRSGLKRWVLGSVAQKVLLGTTRPLLVVRVQGPQRSAVSHMDRIVVPLDGSDASRSILPLVEELAQALGSSLILYTCVSPPDIYAGARVARDAARPYVGITGDQAAEITERLFDQGRLFLEEIADEIEGRGRVKARGVAGIGHAVDGVIGVAEEEKAGLIAMATHGRSGAERWLMGSVAAGVVRRTSLPCLLLRPGQPW